MGIEIRSPKTDQEWLDYYDLRYRVLRKPLNKPRGSEKNEGDSFGEHFALYENQVLKAIARLDTVEPKISQVRFVAVDSEIQGKGYGKLLMEAVEEKAFQNGSAKMILHARDYAVKFYKKLNYNLIGESYKLFNVLQHYLMEKEF
jgi:ribosomal protein S18 acetylase RimI-like enzyme